MPVEAPRPRCVPAFRTGCLRLSMQLASALGRRRAPRLHALAKANLATSWISSIGLNGLTR